jgi:hypothetical protein
LDLVRLRVDLRRIPGTQVIEPQRRHTGGGKGFRKAANAAMRTDRLVAKGLADDDTEGPDGIPRRMVHPSEQSVISGIEVHSLCQAVRLIGTLPQLRFCAHGQSVSSDLL